MPANVTTLGSYPLGGGQYGRPDAGWRLRMYAVIFESDTRAGRAFDLILIALILASVAVVMLDSMASVHA
jgi:voltage-gated potassium channel